MATKVNRGVIERLGTIRFDFRVQAMLDPTDDPQMLGRWASYEIAGIVGWGGMGIVLKGLDVTLGRYVAIKILHPSQGTSSDAERRFAREAQSAASVVHDNVIPIYGVATHHGSPYLVMPYVRGQSLQQRIDQRSPLAIERVLEIALQIARGLAAAHDQGLVHRDIKPSNILIPEDVSRVQITDFGLARAIDDDRLTGSGIIAGTPQYMSPQQAMGQPVDGRTDQFSLGCVIHAMLTGASPFGSESTYGTIRQIIDVPAPSLRDVAPECPMWLSNLTARLLSKQPEGRFEKTSEVAQLLSDGLAHARSPETTDLPRISIPRSTIWSKVPAWILAVTASLIIARNHNIFGMRPHDAPTPPSTDSPPSSEPASAVSGDSWDLWNDPIMDQIDHELSDIETLLSPLDSLTDSRESKMSYRNNRPDFQLAATAAVMAAALAIFASPPPALGGDENSSKPTTEVEVREDFERRLEELRQRVEVAESRLDAFKKELQRREENADELIAKRLEEIRSKEIASLSPTKNDSVSGEIALGPRRGKLGDNRIFALR